MSPKSLFKSSKSFLTRSEFNMPLTYTMQVEDGEIGEGKGRGLKGYVNLVVGFKGWFLEMIFWDLGQRGLCAPLTQDFLSLT